MGEMDGIAELATRLLALPPGQRAVVLRAAGAPDTVLPALAEEVDRLAVSEVMRALEVSELVVALADEHGDGAARARALRARAQALGYAGRFDDALPIYDRAAALAENAGATLEAAHARMSSLHALASLGRYEDAIRAGEAARAAFASAGQPVLAARADVNLGATYQMCDQPEKAIAHLDRARPSFLGDAVTLAKIDSNRGHAFLGMDAFADAELAYAAARPTFEQQGMNWAAAIVEGNLAELATRQGRLQPAFYHFERARRHLERDETPADLARIRAEQCDALATLGLFDDALAGYHAALPELESSGLALEAARCKAGIGRVLVRQSRTAEARRWLDEAAASLAALGHATATARLNVLRGALLASDGQRAAARALLASAAAALADRPADLATARYHLARLALDRGDVDEATAELASAIAIAEELQIAPLLADLLHTRARVQRTRGDSAAAWRDLQAGIACAERVRGALQAERFRAAFHGERLTLYEDAVGAALDCGGERAARDAFAAIELAKSRALLDLVGGAVEPADADPARDADAASAELARQLNTHRRALNGLYSRLADVALGDAAGAPLEKWRDQIRVHEDALAELEARLANARGPAALFAKTIDAATAAAALPAEAALVEYFSSADELLAVVLRGGRAQAFRGLARAGLLPERIQRLYFQIRRAMRPGAADGPRGARLLDDARRELGALHETLIQPLQAALAGASRVVIVPHGPLHAVPFAALWDGARYLLDTAEVVAAPSASVFAQCRAGAAAPRGARGCAVVSVPDAAAPQIGPEAESVAALLAAEVVLRGAEATAARIADAISGAETVHIACHGHFSNENPLASGLKLADRWLHVRDIYDLRLRAALVTLSGCETGQAVVASGDELVGLARAFFAAGTTGLLVSLWTVNDESTADMMTGFYRAWRRGDGQRAATAFRQAQRELAERRPHPAFWAPFVMMGEA